MNKKKLNKQDYIFKNLQNQTLCKLPGQINGIDFYIANLENCSVFLFDWLDQVFIAKIPFLSQKFLFYHKKLLFIRNFLTKIPFFSIKGVD